MTDNEALLVALDPRNADTLAAPAGFDHTLAADTTVVARYSNWGLTWETALALSKANMGSYTATNADTGQVLTYRRGKITHNSFA